jgi:hypothetical protein
MNLLVRALCEVEGFSQEGDGQQMALYYSDGGPGLPTDLVRVNVEGNGSDVKAWRSSTAA